MFDHFIIGHTQKLVVEYTFSEGEAIPLRLPKHDLKKYNTLLAFIASFDFQFLPDLSLLVE